MKRFLVILLLAGSLGACSTLNALREGVPNPLSPRTLAAIEASYNVVLSGAANYRDLCAARSIPSSCRTIVVKLQSLDRRIQSAFVVGRRAQRAGDTITLGSAMNIAQVAVDEFKAVAVQAGVVTGAR